MMLMGVALWIICAPSGYVVGELAREHFMEEKDNHWLSWLCAAMPPVSAALALALILKEVSK